MNIMNKPTEQSSDKKSVSTTTEPAPASKGAEQLSEKPKEHGGPKGLEPTRYGDWERNGRCTDF